MPLEPGSLLRERYRIEAQLGQGGMGAVYRAYDLTLEIQVAVKENLNPNPESERQFKREARLLASLHHPNLPRVTDHFVLEGQQYLVMDYIEGEDLQSLLGKRPVSVAEVLRWADDMCEALHFLHTRTPPIIHRDIKPANVKLQPDGRLVLVDFGIAKSADQTQTATGARGLTPGYSPPEQYGGSTTDQRSDQYALAATLFTLLTRRAPANSIDRMLKKSELVPPSSINPDVPAHVDATLTRAMELHPDQRFATMQEFKEAMHGSAQALTQPGPTVVSRPTVMAPPRPKARFPVAAVAGLGGLGVVAIGAAAFFLLSRGSDSGGQSPEPSATFSAGGSGSQVTALPQPSQTPLPPAPTETNAPAPTATLIPTPTPQQVLEGGGGRIAFISDRQASVLQIFTMNPDGTDQRQLTFDPGDKSYPEWSPDGTRLLYSAPGGAGGDASELGLDIWMVNADGTGITHVVTGPGNDYAPAWSPDGSRIAFTSKRINGLNQVFVIDAACVDAAGGCLDQKPRNVSCGADFCAQESSPAWAPPQLDLPNWLNPGFNLIVAVSINNAPTQIFFRPADPLTPIDFDRRDQLVGVDDLSWSPDGSLVLFTWYYQRGKNEVYVAPVADRAAERIQLTNTNGNKEPAFSPDGNWIVFTSTRDGKPEIYRMTSSGGNQVNISNSPASQDLQPAWQPLGR
jgi:serine/threonine protein kinase